MLIEESINSLLFRIFKSRDRSFLLCYHS